MIRLAVVEDDPGYQRTLVQYVRDFFAGREAYDCSVFDDGVDFLAAVGSACGGTPSGTASSGNVPSSSPSAPSTSASSGSAASAQFDVVFLDIVMARSNGIEVARRIRERDSNVVIIFVTEAVQYALEGYGVQATDFLIKPLYYTSFCSSMQRALAVLKRRAPSMIQINYDKTVTYLDVSTIFYIETKAKGTLIHSQSGDYDCTDTMKDLAAKLAPFGFGRCHQAYIVNTAYVESVRKREVLVRGQWLPMSRYKRDEFVTTLLKEVGGTV